MKIIRFIFSLPFAILLLAVGIAAGSLFSVREAYSEDSFGKMLSSVNWAELELPAEDGTATLCDYANEIIVTYGAEPISTEEFNAIARDSAADPLVSRYATELRAWFLDNSDRPVMDEKEISQTIVTAVGIYLLGNSDEEESGEDIFNLSDLTGLFDALFMDEVAAAVEDQLDLKEAVNAFDRALDEIEPYRIAASTLALYALLAIAGILALVLICINRKGGFGFSHIGFASVLCGIVFLLLSKGEGWIPTQFFAEYHIPKSTFRLLTDPLFASFGTTGTILASAGAIVFILGIAIGSLRNRGKQ